MTNRTHFQYEQTELKDTWKVRHNLRTTDFVIAVYDSRGKAIPASSYTTKCLDENTISIVFSEPTMGGVIVEKTDSYSD